MPSTQAIAQHTNRLPASLPRRNRWAGLSVDEKCEAIIRVYQRSKLPSLSEIAERLTVTFGSPITKNMVSSVVARNKSRFADVEFHKIVNPKAPVLRAIPDAGDTEAFLGHEVPRPPIGTRNVIFRAYDFFKAAPATTSEKKPPMNTQLSPIDGEPVPLKLTLVELENDQCKWPVSGNSGPILFCGHPRVFGKPYCACHVTRSAPRIAEPDPQSESKK